MNTFITLGLKTSAITGKTILLSYDLSIDIKSGSIIIDESFEL